MDTNITQPKVSVHICTFNRADFIGRAIESVLIQTYKNLDILIIDDASTDSTETIIAKYMQTDSRIRYVRNTRNLGITKNRNKALQITDADFVAVLDSDDYWIDTHKIEKQISFLLDSPDVAIVGTQSIRVSQKETILGKINLPLDNTTLKRTALISNPFVHSSVVYRISAIQQYEETFIIWEDYATWLKVGRTYNFANIPDTCTAYRIHTTNISDRNKIRNIIELQKIISNSRKDYQYYILASIKNFLRFFV